MSLFPTKDATYNGQNLGQYQGADFAFFGNAVLQAAELQNFFRSMLTVTAQAQSGSVLANSLFSPGYGYHVYSVTTGASLCSMKLPAASQGMVLILDFGGFAGDANISIMAESGGGVTGVSCLLATGSGLSSFEVSANGFVKLVCEADGKWSIATANASFTPHPDA